MKDFERMAVSAASALTNKPTMNQKDPLAVQPIAEEMFHVNLTPERIARYWSRVKILGQGECWNWIGLISKNGYGRITFYKKQFTSHRVGYFMANGAFPKRMFICHHCDNPKCVNPDHFFIGTALENNRDCASKGRSGPANHPERMPRGTATTFAKLNEEKIREIVELKRKGMSGPQIAARYGVTKNSIYNLFCGVTWRHLTQQLLSIPQKNSE